MVKQMVKQNELDQESILVKQDNVAKSSVLFEGYRALGYYASAIPVSLVKSD